VVISVALDEQLSPWMRLATAWMTSFKESRSATDERRQWQCLDDDEEEEEESPASDIQSRDAKRC